MSIKNLSLSLLLAVLQLSVASYGKSFQLKELKQAKNPTYVLSDVANKMSYYSYVRNVVGPKMQDLAGMRQIERLDNERVLKSGGGVSVKLSENNFNVHINFPNGPTGGRSYGWTQGEVGDWSDAMYLDELSEVIQTKDEKDLVGFYSLLIKVLGASDASSIETLNFKTQIVATNFIAIYTAEAYRAMVPDAHVNWDDALFQTTMLGAFHGGQRKLTMFYVGRFTDETKKQNSGVYNRGKPGVNFSKARSKDAELRDYWQFSAKVDSKQSGINITRNDFEKMGAAITKYEKYVAKNPTVDEIYKVVGGDRRNIIKAISEFFTEGKSKDIKVIDKLAEDVSKLMLDIHRDADKITQSLADGLL